MLCRFASMHCMKHHKNTSRGSPGLCFYIILPTDSVYRISRMPAAPMPVPMHMVTMP